MAEQEQSEGPAEGAAKEKSDKPAAEQAQDGEGQPKAERPKVLPGGASSQRPGLPERAAETKASDRERPPPGGIADLFAQALPDVKLEVYQGLDSVIIEVSRDDIPQVMRAAKDDPSLDCKYLRSLFGVDHLEDGLEVVYQLVSLEKGHEVVIKTRLTRDDPKLPSVTSVWQGANWHERETRDMFGIIFEGHPHLVPLLLPEDMTDHFPLRKDSPLAEIEEWQGELLGEEESKE
ncbi:MAG: NADH-quinone oxidoreductase subunit C [Chloroflexi bacterium]|nr:NADH-quinone oxidoreductase subunit C [Chloroflexota bacterium]